MTAIVHILTSIYTDYELTEQFMQICVKDGQSNKKPANILDYLVKQRVDLI